MATQFAKKGNLTTFLVAANDASRGDKSIADYVCDGTADNVEIQAAMDLIKTAGGTVILSQGTFTCAAAIVMDGAGGADTVTIALKGQGVRTTILSMANNINGISLTDDPKVIIEDIEIQVQGTGSGVISTAEATTHRGFWDSYFRNIFVYCPGATHTGYAMRLEGPFRSTFVNIEGNGLGNGIYLTSTNSAFNPGNCLFERCFMDLSKANGTGYTLYTVDGGGQFNICTFIQCEAIDTNGSSTTSRGWYFRGSSTTYHTTKNIYVLSSNVELFNTAVRFEKSIGNTLQLNYVDVKTGGTIVSADSNSSNNDITVLSGYVPTATTTILIDDSNTDATKPNVIRRYEAYVEGTLNATVTSATQFDRINASGPGTIDTDILIGRTNFASDVLVPDEAYGAGWNASLEVPTKNAVYDKIETLGGGGDVVGPASATDTAVALYDTTTGKLLKNSTVLVSATGVVNIRSDATLATPADDTISIFGRKIAGRGYAAFAGPSGLSSALQPLLARNKVGYWNPPGNNTTVPGIFGFTAPTITGFTATTRNVATTNQFTRFRRLGYVTVSTAGTVGQWRVPVSQFTIGDGAGVGGFTYIIRFGISDAANVSDARMFMGFRTSVTPTNVEPSTLTNCIGVGHGAADTNLKIFYGGSVAQTAIDLGASFPITANSVEMYELALFASPNTQTIQYEVTRLSNGTVATGTLSGTVGTVVPSSTTLMNPWGYRTNNATALAVGLDVASAYIETDY